jgi:hypothetical protein
VFSLGLTCLLAALYFLLFDHVLADPALSVERLEYNLGPFRQEERVNVEIPLRNSGRRPLIVQKVAPSCSCLDHRLSAPVIKPGETATLTLDYDIKDKVVGVQRENVVVLTNDPERSSVLIEVNFEIEGSWAVLPETLRIHGEKGRPVERLVTVVSQNYPDNRIEAVRSDSERIGVEVVGHERFERLGVDHFTLRVASAMEFEGERDSTVIWIDPRDSALPALTLTVILEAGPEGERSATPAGRWRDEAAMEKWRAPAFPAAASGDEATSPTPEPPADSARAGETKPRDGAPPRRN